MRFTDSPVKAIKSISQRALSLYWHRLASGRKFPAIQEFLPGSRLHDLKQLVYWNVESHGGRRRFRAVYRGGNVAEVFRSPWEGKYMDEVVPISLKAFTLDAANECAESGHAIFTVLTTKDSNGQGIDCERLLLPFGEGEKVKQIVASLQLISLTGEFTRQSVLRKFEDSAHVPLAVRIKFDMMSSNAISPVMVTSLPD